VVPVSAYTPGPWFTEATSTIGHHYVVDGDGFTICEPSPMGSANARLIAAAPALVDALRWALDQLDDDLDLDHRAALEAARAVLARVEATP
jgi:hypothetical protein